MAIEFNPGNVGKINNLIQSHPQLNVTDNSKADYASNFKKADADGNGSITRDEFKRFAKDALPATADLSMFGGTETQLADFDVALGEWFDSVDQAGGAAPAAAVSEKASALPSLDAGKTWTKLGAEKIARGEDLNFGHNQVDGELWKLQDGSPVWADSGTQITREQLAAMPDYQVKKFYQMMGLGYDPKVDFPDSAAREKLASQVRIPDPASAASTSLQNLRKDLDSLHAKLSQLEGKLQEQLTGASPATSQQLRAQLAQLGTVKGHVEAMRTELKDYQIPAGLSTKAEARVTDSLKQIHDAVKSLAGADAAGRNPIMATFTLAMSQLRQPERDLKQDTLAQNHHTTLINMSNVMGVITGRIDQLARQRQNAGGNTAAQIDAQMAQLTNVFQGLSQVATPLFAYRSNPELSGKEREQKAAAVDQVDSLIKQMAGADSVQFQRLVDQATKLLKGL